MIIFVTPANRTENEALLKEYFLLRKKVFCDYYGWVEPDADGLEIDEMDFDYNIIILYVDDTSKKVQGGIRLMPTTGKTLLHTVWVDMLPDKDDFRSPNIWEATRFCVDSGQNVTRNNTFVNRICLALILATLEFSQENGITSIIAVCEKKIIDMFAIFNGKPEVLSERTEADGCDIVCVIWSTEKKHVNSIKWAKPFLGGTEPMKLN